jgi:hypothetical protein
VKGGRKPRRAAGRLKSAALQENLPEKAARGRLNLGEKRSVSGYGEVDGNPISS